MEEVGAWTVVLNASPRTFKRKDNIRNPWEAEIQREVRSLSNEGRLQDSSSAVNPFKYSLLDNSTPENSHRDAGSIMLRGH